MGDIADEMIARMQGYGSNGRRRPIWEHVPDRTPSAETPHLPNCRCAMTNGVNTHCSQKVEEPKATPTHIVCSYCQKGGLHWGLDKGKPRLREEGGWIHDCPQVEGV